MYIATIVVVIFVIASGSAIFFLNTRTSTRKPSSEDQAMSEHTQRLSYLMKIVVEHSSNEKRETSAREVVRIGEQVHATGGFRFMVKVQQAVTNATSEKMGSRLGQIWKGIGDWR